MIGDVKNAPNATCDGFLNLCSDINILNPQKGAPNAVGASFKHV